MDFEIRKSKGPGAGKPTRERAAYFQLMEQGYSAREAARIVGINLRTGKRWRNGRHASGGSKAVLPIYQEPGQMPGPPGPERPPVPSRYLQEHDRIHIADRLREKASVRQIAAELGRSPSTISREIGRNRRAMARGGWAYQPFHAHRRAERRRPPAQGGQDRPESRAAGLRPGPPHDAVEPRADLPGAAGTLPRPAGDARDPRDVLFIRLARA